MKWINFFINSIQWTLIIVTPNNSNLIDRTGQLTLATTDPIEKRVYISSELYGRKRERVLAHELAHCIMVSYGLVDDLDRLVKPENRIEAEEWVCNFLSENCNELLEVLRYL